MSFMELVKYTEIALKLDRIADEKGYVQGPKMYKELKKTASEIHSMVQAEMKRKRN